MTRNENVATGRGETHTQWLRARTPPAPHALLECIEALFEFHPAWESLPRADALVEASELLLHRVLAGTAMARTAALDLLAADACVTYAFEAAADEPDTIARRAGEAERRIAAVAAAFAGSVPLGERSGQAASAP
ncbi:MAG TPA: hypothetical protein VHE78_14595 [Gemmatimonadaceae bacterium]|nr:hypothetical protein [Gemmatimonadaceae bacterium]